MICKIEGILEDAENGLPIALRQALNAAKQQFECMVDTIAIYDECLGKSIQTHHECKKLLKLEGVGPINAVNLYISLGCAQLGTFSKGKDASACIGLTLIQNSSGGKVKLGTISKKCRNSMLRSQLIGGAMSVVRQVVKRDAKTKKEMWIKALAERRGNKCAAVALAKKNRAYCLCDAGTRNRVSG
jgi:transposase